MNKKLSDDELQEKDSNLTFVATQIRMVERLLETIEYAKLNNDSFAIYHQINTGVFNDINDVLQNIRVYVQKISDKICPE
ncbi:hypothetical protein P7H50_03885 [Enterococcus durans]|uniref:hypothetical protein n=1 Tax=Enterococcus durans TaxID=53345 RepID=UPI0028922149|nr:hypothetical protein [Enterococcus durans]MDT2836028.1 hypothetical protein [Enterococcus durans]